MDRLDACPRPLPPGTRPRSRFAGVGVVGDPIFASAHVPRRVPQFGASRRPRVRAGGTAECPGHEISLRPWTGCLAAPSRRGIRRPARPLHRVRPRTGQPPHDRVHVRRDGGLRRSKARRSRGVFRAPGRGTAAAGRAGGQGQPRCNLSAAGDADTAHDGRRHHGATGGCDRGDRNAGDGEKHSVARSCSERRGLHAGGNRGGIAGAGQSLDGTVSGDCAGVPA